MSLNLPPRGIELILLPLVIGAAVYDMRYRRIPNWLNVLGALLGLALNAWLIVDGRPWPGLFFALKGLGMGFGIYFVLYAIRAMGAGDVKLMGAIGALVGWQNWFGIFLITAVVGGISAVM